MKSRLINVREEDAHRHEEFMRWWVAHGWPGVALALLPKCGILVEDYAGRGVAAGWLYMDNSVGVSMLEWVVTNPANTARQSYLGISLLVQSAREVAASLDYGVILTTAKQDALVRAYERCGFVKTDEQVTHLVMVRKD